MAAATQKSKRERLLEEPAHVTVAPVKSNRPGLIKKSLGRIDVPFLTLVLVLLLLGLVILFSASYPTGYIRYGDSLSFIMPQLKFALVGIGFMLLFAVVDYHILKKLAWPLMLLALVLLVVVLFTEGKNEAQRWIWLNSEHTQSFQPSELAKFAVILLFAALISANQNRIKTFIYGFLPFVLLLCVVACLLILEPHLSCTILILGIGIIMMFSGGTAIRWFILGGVVIVVAVFFAITMFKELVPYAESRITTWLDPFNAPKEKAHQTIQSLIAVGSGGLTGVGIGNSVQKFLHLPEMYNDYIFAILCEELGFVGAAAVIILFLLLLVRGLMIAVRAKDKFGSMLVIGISVQIALQTFLHIAVNTNAIPSTGISLPFFSSGGSSLVLLLAEIGVILSVSRQGKAKIAAGEKNDEEAPNDAEAYGARDAGGEKAPAGSLAARAGGMMTIRLK